MMRRRSVRRRRAAGVRVSSISSSKRVGVPPAPRRRPPWRNWRRSTTRGGLGRRRAGRRGRAARLRSAGCTTAWSSRTPTGRVRRILRRVGLEPYHVDLVVDSHEEGVEKPDPRIFEIALARSAARRGPPRSTAATSTTSMSPALGRLACPPCCSTPPAFTAMPTARACGRCPSFADRLLAGASTVEGGVGLFQERSLEPGRSPSVRKTHRMGRCR